MAACVRGNKIDDALRLFSQMKDIEEETISKEEKESRDLNYLNSLPSFATATFYPPTSPFFLNYSSLLSSSSSSSSSPFSSSSTSTSLIRDTYSYGTALHALGKKGEWREALKLLDHLDNVGTVQISTGGSRRIGVQRTTVMVR